jgi:hypothetical protein
LNAKPVGAAPASTVAAKEKKPNTSMKASRSSAVPILAATTASLAKATIFPTMVRMATSKKPETMAEPAPLASSERRVAGRAMRIAGI